MNRSYITAIVISLFAGLLPARSVQAQATPAQIMYDLYRVYDSVPFFSFDVQYTYTSDTVAGDFMYDRLKGSYTVNGRKAWYTLGDMEYMQNDSFFIAVYNKDRFIIVSDPRFQNAGSLLPLRQTIDSMLLKYQEHYTVSNTTSDTLGKLQFTRLDSLATLDQFTLWYHPAQHYVKAVEYGFTQMTGQEGPEEGQAPTQVARHRRLRLDFSNYRFDRFDEAIYDQNRYIYLEDGEWKGAGQYRDFRIYYSRSGTAGDTPVTPPPAAQ